MKLPELPPDSPMYRSPEEEFRDYMQRKINEIYGMMFSIDRRLEDIAKSVEKNDMKLEELEETISYFTYIPSRPLFLKYNHRTQELYFQRNLKMKFEKNEADLLSVMFKKSDHRPLKKTFYCAEVSEKLSSKNGEVITSKSVYNTIIRIQNKIDMKYRIGHIFTVTTKEFYFYRK